MTSEEPPPRTGRFAGPAIAVSALCIAAACGLGLYAFAQRGGKPMMAHTGACARSLDTAQALEGLVRGEVAALAPARQPRDLRSISFDDADGRKTSVAAFAGRTLLVNLWATWCVPCRTEMPSLDRLQAQLGSPAFTVVPVDVDQLRLEKARNFFKETGVKSLPYYADTSVDIVRALNSQGLPTTVLIGSDGCEIATMAGPAQWDSPEAKALIQRAETAPPKQS